MKKDFLKISLPIYFLFTYGCNHLAEEKNNPPENAGKSVPISMNTSKIPLDSAEQEIANYAGFCNANNWDTAVQAFSISSYDILSSIGKSSQSAVKDVRVYIGIRGNEVANDFHLFIIPLKVGTDQDSIPYYGTDSAFVYDLTTPCPKTCDANSDLYRAFNPNRSNIKWKPVNK